MIVTPLLRRRNGSGIIYGQYEEEQAIRSLRLAGITPEVEALLARLRHVCAAEGWLLAVGTIIIFGHTAIGAPVMTARTPRGINYSFQDSIVEFFGVKGCRQGTDSWAINVRTSSIDLEIDARSATGWIRERIQHAIRAGSGQEMTQLRLGPRSAVFLFLDGGLTCDHLARATEGDEFVQIPDVSLGGRTLAIRIVPEPKYEVTASSASRLCP